MFTIKDIIASTRGRLLQGKDSVTVKGVSTDSRSIGKGDLFVAIIGDRFDGHDFVKGVAQRAAGAILVSNKNLKFPKNIPVILVKDTIMAYGQLARAHRDRFKIPVIAITGSAGKTTTKEMVASVLAKHFRVLKNYATYNNHIGVPATLLKLNSSHEIVVIEFGTNRFGDIRWLTRITNPTVALFTNIGESHLEFLKSPEGVFKEKFELVSNMENPGTVIFNGDDKYLRRIASKKLEHQFISYGTEKNCALKASDIKTINGESLQFKVNGHTFILNSPLAHNIHNALAATACGRLFQISIGVIKSAIARVPFPDGRGVVRKFGSMKVIDDTYNANPISFRSAISALGQLNGSGRKILVCGDMLELGRQSAKLHRSLGKFAAQIELDLVLTIGKFSRLISTGVRKINDQVEAHHCATMGGINNRLSRYCRPGDTILIKGSRGMRMERAIQFLKENAKG